MTARRKMDDTKELPKRKKIRLKKHDYSSIGAYFVTVCIKDRKPILSDIVEPVGDGAYDVPPKRDEKNPFIRLKPLGSIIEKHLMSSENIPGVTIDQYVIMPDHIHAIIFLDPDKYTKRADGTSRAPSPTNKMLPHIISTFKRFCNREIGENVFQRSYVEHVIRNRDDYYKHIKYICNNPIERYYRERVKTE